MPVVQAASTATTGSGRASQPGFNLPPELVDQAASRLCWISNLFAFSSIAILLMHGAFQPEFRPVLDRPVIRLLALAVLFCTLGFIAAHRFGWLSKINLIRLGTAWEVLVAFYIAFFETAVQMTGADLIRGMSSVALWIAMTGFLIPNTPSAKLLSGSLSALMWPLAYTINHNLNGGPGLPWNKLFVWMAPIALTVLWTYLLNKRMYQMHINSQKAEDLGSYQLDFMIGRGGMGEVWRARHKMLQRDAAIKIIRPEVLATQAGRQAAAVRKRFEKEAKATASLRSPHTVALFDFGMAKDSSFYYVMELLDGIDLHTLVERFGPVDPGRVARILIEACDSLEEAHRQGLVHRDVKPTNIFLCRLGQNYDFTKVLDFGLVKSLHADADMTQMTMDGQATGTPAYMAPEVAMGSANIDQRADIYGLGCVAYFLLTGQMVFNEPTPTALALAHVQKPPVPPSERTETRIPASLERIVLQCLEKDPEQRPRSAQELARAIENATDVNLWTREEASRWWSTNLPASPGSQPYPTPASDRNLISLTAAR